MSDIPFDEKYEKSKCFWGEEPAPTVMELLDYIDSGEVLDLGTGEGKNALFLAEKGFDVVGMDKSKEGVKKFLKLAEERDLRERVEGTVADLTEFEPDKNFDVIVCIATLNFLEKNEIRKVIKTIKEHTRKEGLNVITAFTVDDPGYKRHPEKLYFFENDELKDLYEDWEILKYDESMTEPEKHGTGGKVHRHGVAALIARKI